MCRTKLFRCDSMIRMVSIVDPQVNGAILSADGQLKRDDFASELTPKRRLLQNLEVERLRFKGIDLATGFCGSRENGGRVADVRADIQHISSTDEGGKGAHQGLQIVLNLTLVDKEGRLE